jgi:hypothetical protein
LLLSAVGAGTDRANSSVSLFMTVALAVAWCPWSSALSLAEKAPGRARYVLVVFLAHPLPLALFAVSASCGYSYPHGIRTKT